jgi:hypothetical protein
MKDGLGLHFTSSFLAVCHELAQFSVNTTDRFLLIAGYRRDNNMRTFRRYQVSGQFSIGLFYFL